MAAMTMRAVMYDGYGGDAASLKHVEVPIPSPKANEVLLKLEARSINPLDWKLQSGMLRLILPIKFPFVPIRDVAGEVTEVGSGVNSFKAGDKVVAWLDVRAGGGLAEFAVASASLTVHRPSEVTAADAAGLPTAAITALQALRSVGAKFDGTGESADVLVTAASGGVGVYAVQLAKLAGLHVTATCGARNMDLVRGLGADEVVDYKTAEGVSLESPSGRRYAGVIHCATGTPWSVFDPVLADRGKVVDITPTLKTVFSSVLKRVALSRKSLVPLVMSTKEDDLRFLVELLRDGKLKTVVDSRFPLGKAEEAWAKSMDGHATGKIIVEMGG